MRDTRELIVIIFAEKLIAEGREGDRWRKAQRATAANGCNGNYALPSHWLNERDGTNQHLFAALGFLWRQRWSNSNLYLI
jgi:hypothetical protein